MYCVNCGVKLADSEKKCPLCGVVAYHPDIPQQSGATMFPPETYPEQPVSRHSLLVVLTTAVLISMVITLLCDFQMSPGITWSGYVIGGLALGYLWFVLPLWFQKPSPAVFVPCSFCGALLYLLYIACATGGNWFLSFAFPVTGGVGLIVTALAVLLQYVRRGRLYIIGGSIVALGLFMPVVGFLLNLTFYTPAFALWSVYPLTALVLLGGMLIFLAICRPARETMERKFFL